MPFQLSSLSSLQGHAGTPHASQDQDCGGEVAAGGEQKPRKKARIKWITYARGTGFKAARVHLETLARRECDGMPLGPRGDTTSTHTMIQYTSVQLPQETVVLRMERQDMHRTQNNFWSATRITFG